MPRHKGYLPEQSYKFRREILSEIKGVKKIIPSDWLITQKFLDKHKINTPSLFVHRKIPKALELYAGKLAATVLSGLHSQCVQYETTFLIKNEE